MTDSSAQLSLLPFRGTDDILIVGGGLAGLFCALRLSPRPVTVLTPSPLGFGSSSGWAQAGIAAPVSSDDSVSRHLSDTVRTGCGLVNEKMAELMISEASSRLDDLLSYGVPFDRTPDDESFVVSREAAHSASRIVGVSGDRAGSAIMTSLVERVRSTPSIRVLEGYLVRDLTLEGGSVSGVIACDESGLGSPTHLFARAVVLASGGVGHLYNVTTNPHEACGTGIGLAARAGALLADLEFIQFHPTAISVGADPVPLASESLRGHGAVLVDDSGERFMASVHPDSDLAPRDIVSRAIAERLANTSQKIYLDCRESPGSHFAEQFPTVYESCISVGIDPTTELIPVAPAAHYCMGGVLVDAYGRTSLNGLWACGEVSCSGVHGANRLASNSLLEAVVFASRIADDLSSIFPHARLMPHDGDITSSPRASAIEDDTSMTTLRRTMTDCFGVLRTPEGMTKGLKILRSLSSDIPNHNFLNSLTTARLIAGFSLYRRESRGGHYRSDYPDLDSSLCHRHCMTLSDIDTFLGSLEA